MDMDQLLFDWEYEYKYDKYFKNHMKELELFFYDVPVTGNTSKDCEFIRNKYNKYHHGVPWTLIMLYYYFLNGQYKKLDIQLKHLREEQIYNFVL